MTLDRLDAAAFEPHVGSAFVATTGSDGPVTLELTEVETLPVHPGAPRTDPFRIVFTGPASPMLTQQIHGLDHPVLGSFELFIVPVGLEPTGDVVYEAIFN